MCVGVIVCEYVNVGVYVVGCEGVMLIRVVTANPRRSFFSQNKINASTLFVVSTRAPKGTYQINEGVYKLSRVVAAHNNLVPACNSFTSCYILTMSVLTKYGCWTILQLNNFEGELLMFQEDWGTFEYFRTRMKKEDVLP